MASNPYKTYLKNEIEGATKGKLILLLYDGAIKFLIFSKKAIEKQDIETAHNNIIKAENIIYELMSTLNMEAGEISENLLKMYDFMIWQLIEANKEKNKEKIDSVIRLLSTLREAWKEVVVMENGTQIENKEKEMKSINFAG
jgi:flagellar protein FliS